MFNLLVLYIFVEKNQRTQNKIVLILTVSNQLNKESHCRKSSVIISNNSYTWYEWEKLTFAFN